MAISDIKSAISLNLRSPSSASFDLVYTVQDFLQHIALSLNAVDVSYHVDA